MAPPTKGPGILLRLYNPLPSSSSLLDPSLEVPGANITSVTTFTSTDDHVATGSPSRNIVYEVRHISKLLTGEAFAKDLAQSRDVARDLSWQVYKVASTRSRPGYDQEIENGVLPSGVTMICVGVTPREEAFEEYAKWFDEEHAELLSKVPGWIKSSRFELAKSFGGRQGGEVAPFIAVHFYDAVNGLGGPEWKRSVDTEWTRRIRENCVVPHFRRVWVVQEQKIIS